MSNVLKGIAFTLCGVLLPLVAHAEEGAHGGEHGWDTGALIASVINFVLLISLFVFLFGKAVSKGLKERRAQVEEALNEAAALKAEAEAKHKEYSERMAKLDSELEQIKTEMIAAGKKERDRIVAEAEHKAARLRQETEFVIEQYAKQLHKDLTREAVEGAVDAAEKLLVKSATAFDQQRLAQDYLASLDKDNDKKGTPSSAPKPSAAQDRP